jgi:hypothetical protein
MKALGYTNFQEINLIWETNLKTKVGKNSNQIKA